MRYWDDKDAAGKTLTDGRICLVIDPEDGTQPIRTYGRDKDEVLEKVARTAEAAQAMINRQRSAQVTPTLVNPARPGTGPAAASVAATPTRRAPVTPDEQMQATADLSNPAKAPAAAKTLLRAAGLDVDELAKTQAVQRVSQIAQQWERAHPDFPSNERNRVLLMNTAALRVGFTNITAETFDAVYQELIAANMLFGDDNEPALPAQTPPDGSPESRVVRPRSATSYRSTALRATIPTAKPQPKYTRAQIHAMSGAEFESKIKNEPGFREWYDREFSVSTA